MEKKVIVLIDKDGFSDIKLMLESILSEEKIKDVEIVLDKDFKKISDTNDTCFVFDYDNQDIKDYLRSKDAKMISFGKTCDADLCATDNIDTEGGINFKLNYKGSIVPVWLKNSKPQSIQNALLAFSVADALGVSILDISERLKNY